MVFFDIDGTLLDFKTAERRGVEALYALHGPNLRLTGPAFYEAWCAVAERHFGRFLAGEVSFAEQKRERVKDIWQGSGIALSDEQAEHIFDTYLRAFEANWSAFDDVRPCLEALQGRQRLGIISNGDRMQQTAKLDKLGLRQAFEIIITPEDVGASKPASLIFLEACRRAGLPPTACTYVGDSLQTDVLPADQAGMHGVWIVRGNVAAGGDSEVTTITSLAHLPLCLDGRSNHGNA